METMNRVMGAVKVVGAVSLVATFFVLTGPVVYLVPLAGIGAGLWAASGVRAMVTGE